MIPTWEGENRSKVTIKNTTTKEMEFFGFSFPTYAMGYFSTFDLFGYHYTPTVATSSYHKMGEINKRHSTYTRLGPPLTLARTYTKHIG